MTLIVLTLMIFTVTLALSVSAFYFLVEAPAEKRRLRARLAAIQQSTPEALSGEAQLLRRDVLSQIPALNRFFLRIPLMSRLRILMQQGALAITPAMLLLISLLLGLILLTIGLAAGAPAVFVVLMTMGAAAVPFVIIAYKRQRRFSRFEEVFPDAIDLLSRAVRAGHAFTVGLDLIGRELQDPVASEFRVTYEQHNLGMPLADALRNLTVRMPLPDVHFFVSALQIHRESGGNLAEILDDLSYLIRERFKILRQAQVYTAQGRATLYILTALPPVTACVLYLLNPGYIGRLFSDPLGQKALAAAVVLQVLGYLVIRRIIRIRV
jgi:tight adherence protein B